jgi:type IV pilus assembly protein PilM
MFERLRQPVFTKRARPEAVEPASAGEVTVADGAGEALAAQTPSKSVFKRLREPVFTKRARPEAVEPASAEEATAADGAGEAVAEQAPAKGKKSGLARAARSRPGRQRARRGGSNERTLVGLDIEPGMVVAAKSRLNGHLEVERAGYVALAPDTVRDGEVNNVDVLGEALAELFKSSDLDRHVRIGIANQRIMMRRIELPPLTDANEIDLAVRFQAQDEIPMPIETVVLDYRSLGIIDSGTGPRLNVLLVAARRDMVERVLQASRQAGLQPEGVDLAAFGMVRALRPLDAGETEQILYLSVGGMTNLAISNGPTCEFTRVIASGIEQIAGDVASRCAITLVEARALLSAVGAYESAAVVEPPFAAATLTAPDPAAAFAAPGQNFDPGLVELPAMPGDQPPLVAAPVSPQDAPVSTPAPASEQAHIARVALGDGVRRIAAEVRNSLDFYLAAQREEPVTRAVLCGPALEIPDFELALSRELGIDVARGEVALASPGAAGNVPTSLLAVAAGLSVPEGPQ